MNKNIKNTVFKILQEEEYARKDDNYLILRTIQELAPEIAGTTFATVMFNLGNYSISLESITRAIRKFQQIYPELFEERIRKSRQKCEEDYYIEYSNR